MYNVVFIKEGNYFHPIFCEIWKMYIVNLIMKNMWLQSIEKIVKINAI